MMSQKKKKKKKTERKETESARNRQAMMHIDTRRRDHMNTGMTQKQRNKRNKEREIDRLIEKKKRK